MTNGRVRLLLSKGHSCYRPRKTGERKRKSVRGCIVDSNLSVLNLVIVKKGDNDIPGLTDRVVPRRLGPKRAGKIRKLFNLTKEDDVTQYIIRRPIATKEGKPEPAKPKTKRHVMAQKRPCTRRCWLRNIRKPRRSATRLTSREGGYHLLCTLLSRWEHYLHSDQDGND